MDLIYTNASHIDQGVLSAYLLDLSYGADENDFEITLGRNEPSLEKGSLIYIEGTEYGGIVDGLKTSSDSEFRVYFGRTWHGLMNSKVIAINNTLTGEAGQCIDYALNNAGLYGLFWHKYESSVFFDKFKPPRYSKVYDFFRDYLAARGAKLKLEWEASDHRVILRVVPIDDYTDNPIDSDVAHLEMVQNFAKVNHLICMGRGEGEDRDIIHLYVDQFGEICDVKHFDGIDEIVEVYDYSNVESLDELRQGGTKRLKELRNTDKTEMDLQDGEQPEYDIGDKVATNDIQTGVIVSAFVSQKIIRIKNGAISTEYKTRG